MSSLILPASAGMAACAELPSDSPQRQARLARQRLVSWLSGLLLLAVCALGLVGTEARMFVQVLSVLDPAIAMPWSLAVDGEAQTTSLPQVDGMVRRNPAQAQPARVPPVLSGHALGHNSESRVLRKPVAVNLSPEQALLARHIATEYRRALDFSRELVHHAYQVARDAQVDPLLVLAIVSVESRFNPLAESPAGAQGLMQVLTRVHFAKFRPFGGIQAAFDPVANLKVGTAILRHYLQSHETVALALKAYVGAAQAEHDFGYGAKVLAARALLADVVGASQDPAQNSAPVRMVPVVDRAPANDTQDAI